MDMRGLSTWLFSKVVMFIFLVSVFSIMAGVLSIVEERSYASAAEALNIQLSDGLQGVVFSSATYVQKVIPLPDGLPSDNSHLSERNYMVEFGKSTGLVYIAMSWDSASANPQYVSSASVYYPENTNFEWSGGSDNYFRVSSGGDFNYIVFTRDSSGSVCIRACERGDVTGCTECE
jgi:hypothetical protein